ncbi:NPC intracellular cholesterol transporter 2-like [Neocloeon triangulifer]|uniref:NPC intracellular cholesterol transporter 2-like n=1 Tax=Neocloeon triangulifer TaxID=2078957 RepID=UPI00286ED503|nr:NPC intracellular cholesterol transporter 2-like [Neocloeon triangulifer]
MTRLEVGIPPLNITLHGCDKYPCSFARGSNISGGMDFMYNIIFKLQDKELSRLTPDVTVYWLGLPIGWPIHQDDGCQSLSMNSCPIKPNTRARYEYSLYLDRWVPLVSPYVWFKFRDAKGDIAICCEVPIKVVDNEIEES